MPGPANGVISSKRLAFFSISAQTERMDAEQKARLEKEHATAVGEMKDKIEVLKDEEQMEYLVGLMDGLETCMRLVPEALEHPQLQEFGKYVRDRHDLALIAKLANRSNRAEN